MLHMSKCLSSAPGPAITADSSSVSSQGDSKGKSIKPKKSRQLEKPKRASSSDTHRIAKKRKPSKVSLSQSSSSSASPSSPPHTTQPRPAAAPVPISSSSIAAFASSSRSRSRSLKVGSSSSLSSSLASGSASIPCPLCLTSLKSLSTRHRTNHLIMCSRVHNISLPALQGILTAIGGAWTECISSLLLDSLEPHPQGTAPSASSSLLLSFAHSSSQQQQQQKSLSSKHRSRGNSRKLKMITNSVESMSPRTRALACQHAAETYLISLQTKSAADIEISEELLPSRFTKETVRNIISSVPH
jgi:hypothetical protein